MPFCDRFPVRFFLFFFFNDTATTEIYTLSLHDALPIWLLGSSGYSAQLAGVLGLPFSFAHHFSSANTIPALALYRQSFRPSRWLERPHAMVAVSTICADTDERARWLGGPAALSFVHL